MTEREVSTHRELYAIIQSLPACAHSLLSLTLLSTYYVSLSLDSLFDSIFNMASTLPFSTDPVVRSDLQSHFLPFWPHTALLSYTLYIHMHHLYIWIRALRFLVFLVVSLLHILSFSTNIGSSLFIPTNKSLIKI